LQTAVFLFGTVLIFNFSIVYAITFKIASYNVQNLFDLKTEGTEYPDYIPDGPSGWNRKMRDIKLGRIAKVLADLDADILCLQEIESKTALVLLNEGLRRMHKGYPYAAVAREGSSATRCAVLSRFEVLAHEEIGEGGEGPRSILKLTLDVEGRPLIVYVNHWKSKTGPESMRIPYAQALAASLQALAPSHEFILIGDFNSDYDEYRTFQSETRLNDTGGITGINHILATLQGGRLVDEPALINGKKNQYLYNLWLELPEERRWSTDFFGKKNSPDSILLPKSMYDEKGIAYIDNSFDRFDPDYLFNEGRIHRWRQADGRGRHFGEGYSDHLPVFAWFTTDAFRRTSAGVPIMPVADPVSIAGLYETKTGDVNCRATDCVVIYKEGENAVIKQKDGRAIYVYRAAGQLEIGMAYNLTVRRLNRHYGNLEVTDIADIKQVGGPEEIGKHLIYAPVADLSASHLRNEVIGRLSGTYKDGRLFYGEAKSIRLYFSKGAASPKNNSSVEISGARIGYHLHPEIIIEKTGQVR